MKTKLENFSVSELLDLAAGIAALIKTAFPEAGESKPNFSGFDMCNIPRVIDFQIEILRELPMRLPEDLITDYREAIYPENSTFPQEEEKSTRKEK